MCMEIGDVLVEMRPIFKFKKLCYELFSDYFNFWILKYFWNIRGTSNPWCWKACNIGYIKKNYLSQEIVNIEWVQYM